MASPPKGSGNGHGRKRPSKYLSHSSKKRRGLELRSGLQGFLVTCDGGRERPSCREAIQLVERFYDKLGQEEPGTDTDQQKASKVSEEKPTSDTDQQKASNNSKASSVSSLKGVDKALVSNYDKESASSGGESEKEEDNANEKEHINDSKGENIDSLLEEEIAELRDKKQARFASLETGCSGVVFIRMLREDVGSGVIARGPNRVVEAIMENCIHFKKPLTRYCLRFLPVEVTCYASADEVRKMAEGFLSQHFPVAEKDKALKFAVVYEARANTSLDRMEIINAVAKLVSQPHSVDLKNPDKTIIVQVVKTICAIGVVSNYKQYAKYNLRQLTTPKQES